MSAISIAQIDPTTRPGAPGSDAPSTDANEIGVHSEIHMRYLLIVLLLATFCTDVSGASIENLIAENRGTEDAAKDGEMPEIIPEVVEEKPAKKNSRGGRFSIRIDTPKPGELGNESIRSDRYRYGDIRRKRYGHDADSDGDGLHDALDPSKSRGGFGR